jgi:hypothetical protein
VYELLWILMAVFLFYVLVPGIGAFVVRRDWRVFRTKLIAASTVPSFKGKGTTAEQVKFLGRIDAVEEDRYLWLKSANSSLRVDILNALLYEISMVKSSGMELSSSAEGIFPRKITANELLALGEKTKVLAYGALENSRGILTISGNQPFILAYDGDEQDIMHQAVLSGRHRNEYWNPLTPVSLIAGALLCFVLSYVFFRQAAFRFHAIISILAGFLPIIPLSPPGYFLFDVYKRLWSRGRELRADRDLLVLPLRYLDRSSGGQLPDGEPYLQIQAKTLEKFDGIRIRRPSIESDTKKYSCFGSPSSQGLKPPSECLVEYLAIRGNPVYLSTKCAQLAHRFELGAAAVFVLGILLNSVLIFLALAYFLW